MISGLHYGRLSGRPIQRRSNGNTKLLLYSSTFPIENQDNPHYSFNLCVGEIVQGFKMARAGHMKWKTAYFSSLHLHISPLILIRKGAGDAETMARKNHNGVMYWHLLYTHPSAALVTELPGKWTRQCSV